MTGFDIIGITESWLHDAISSSQIGFDGYKLYRQDRGLHNTKKKKRGGGGGGGGGIVVYVKDAIGMYLNLILQYCRTTNNLEQLWLEVCKPNYKRQIIGVIYCHRQEH